MLSGLGRRLYMPRSLMTQAAEAARSAHRINACVGMALDRGTPLLLSALRRAVPDLDPREIVAYAPPAGVPSLRESWLDHVVAANPPITKSSLSLPVVVPGLTFGVSASVDMFVDPGDPVIVPEPYWPNYRLIIEERAGGVVEGCALFDGGLAVGGRGLREAFDRLSGRSKIVVLLNFPHNPTGYSPTEGEAEEVVKTLVERAESGVSVVCILDDAYTGLWYERGLFEGSLFSELCAAHPNVLAVKIDGATKEELAWGLRIGFTSFGSLGLTPAHHAIMEEKLTGHIRSTLSSSSALSQHLLLRAFRDNGHEREKEAVQATLLRRYRRCRELTDAYLPEGIVALPYNSGYFFTLCLALPVAHGIREALLEDEGMGIIAIDDHHLRIAYSSVDLDDINALVAAICDVWKRLT